MTERDCCRCTYSDKEDGLTRYSNGEAVFCSHSQIVQNEEWMGIAVSRNKAATCPHFAGQDWCTEQDDYATCDANCPLRDVREMEV